jgi:hypothetical protein
MKLLHRYAVLWVLWVLALVVTAILSVLATLAVITPDDPHCPTRDSCTVNYEDGRWKITEVEP